MKATLVACLLFSSAVFAADQNTPQFTSKPDGSYSVVIRGHEAATVYPTAMKEATQYCAKKNRKYQIANFNIETKTPDMATETGMAMGRRGLATAAGFVPGVGGAVTGAAVDAAGNAATAAARQAMTEFTGTLDFHCL